MRFRRSRSPSIAGRIAGKFAGFSLHPDARDELRRRRAIAQMRGAFPQCHQHTTPIIALTSSMISAVFAKVQCWYVNCIKIS
jgi:hypothetical protein